MKNKRFKKFIWLFLAMVNMWGGAYIFYHIDGSDWYVVPLFMTMAMLEVVFLTLAICSMLNTQNN